MIVQILAPIGWGVSLGVAVSLIGWAWRNVALIIRQPLDMDNT